MKKILFLIVLLVIGTSGFAFAQEQPQEPQLPVLPQQEQEKQVPPESTEPPDAEQPQEETATPQEMPDTALGRIYIPRAFVHADQDFKPGVYVVSMFEKDGMPWFKVFNKKKELLFEEMAVVKPRETSTKEGDTPPTPAKKKFFIRKEMLKGYEYFRIRVINPDKLIMAYLLVKQPKNAEADSTDNTDTEKTESNTEEPTQENTTETGNSSGNL